MWGEEAAWNQRRGSTRQCRTQLAAGPPHSQCIRPCILCQPTHHLNPPEHVHLFVVLAAQQDLGGHVGQRSRLPRHVVLLALPDGLPVCSLLRKPARQARRRRQARPAGGR